jgi:uncharacterized membrane protein
MSLNSLTIRANALWQAARTSYWFLPALAVLFAIALSIVADRIDRSVGEASSVDWIYGGGASGARELVGAIAASTITVAGVVFSVTVVTLSLASQQFGPRVLRTFMRDLGTQIVLATFIGTFVYALLVLRRIRGEDASGEAYIPGISVTLAVALAVASVAALVYIIHHTAVSIRAGHITAVIGSELQRSMRSLFPGDLPGHFAPLRAEERADTVITARGDGYVASIAVSELVAMAARNNVVAILRVRPGTFVVKGDPLLALSSAIPEEAMNAMCGAVVLGRMRESADKDVLALIEQISQVALRALSPSLNDPFTATQCIDWLTAAFAELAPRPPPVNHLVDGRGEVRVVLALGLNFEELLSAAFAPLRDAAMSQALVANAVLESLRTIGSRVSGATGASAVMRLAESMLRAASLADDDMPGLQSRLRAVAEVTARHAA